MEEAPADRARLGERIRQRRGELGMSVSAAARIAQIDRGTWTGIENAARRTEEYNFAGIERVLQWAPGSIAAILTGGDPTPLGDQPQAAAAALPYDFDLSAELDKIMRLPIPAQQKLKLASQVTDLYEQAQAEHRVAER